jgi:hypothetical protein
VVEGRGTVFGLMPRPTSEHQPPVGRDPVQLELVQRFRPRLPPKSIELLTARTIDVAPDHRSTRG